MSPLITLAKNQLKKVLHDAKSIDVRVEPDHGHYLIKIHVRLPGAILHAEKRDQNVSVAMDQAMDAVLKQFEKQKTRMQKIGRPGRNLWQKEPAHA